jgi:hypothetical protein
MIAFSEGLERWHDFFLLAGTAGFTLLGLLFVSVSLKTDTIMRSEQPHLRLQAMSSFESLMFVMILALMALVPFNHPRLAGGMLLVLGLMGMLRATVHVIRLRVDRRTPAGVRRQLVLPLAAHVMVAWGGISILTQSPNTALALLAAVVWLLVTATRGAWRLLVEVGETPAA